MHRPNRLKYGSMAIIIHLAGNKPEQHAGSLLLEVGERNGEHETSNVSFQLHKRYIYCLD